MFSIPPIFFGFPVDYSALRWRLNVFAGRATFTTQITWLQTHGIQLTSG